MTEGPRPWWERLGLLSALRPAGRPHPPTEVLAALALLVIAVPEQLATSRLAGMPPVTGLYAFVAGTVAFAVLGSNPQLSVGADSTIAPLFAVALAHLAPAGSADYVALAGLLAVVVGVFVAAVGLLRLGWIAEFLSAPIITGFLAGVAVIIVVHQLPDVLGLPSVGGNTLHRLHVVVSHLGQANGWSVAITLAVLGLVVVADRVDRRLPAALVGLVGSTALVAGAHLGAHGVAVLGAVAHGAPHVGLHLSWTALRQVLPVSAVVALVVISQSAATSRAFADAGDYRVDMGRDFVGVGAGSILSGLAGAFAVDASPARTAAVAGAGGRTQWSGLGAAVAVVALVPAAGVLKDVPVATLGAILVFIASRIFHLRDLLAVRRFDLFEFALAVVTLLTVALIGVEQGIGVAVGLAIIDRTRLSATPKVHLLGRVPGTTSWEPLSEGNAAAVPGVAVLLFATPLYYANAEHVRSEVERALAKVDHPRAVVLDVIGMHDVDFTGSRVLGRLLDELGHHQVTVGLARAGDHLVETLTRAGLLDRIGRGHLFPSVDAAVQAVSPGG
ncbi:MAG: SulP family inorganic anion transporter [Acidobacteriota bacterium]|nr:SulP family inorganic anion transporter [Acidobacteriota bacterium]